MKTGTFRLLVATFRLEIGKTFLSRRNLWVYVLALAPALLYAANSIYAPRERARLAAIAAQHPKVTSDALSALNRGDSLDEVTAQLGAPYQQRSFRRRIGPDRIMQRDDYRYTDGQADVRLLFNNGRLSRIQRTDPETLANDQPIFASVFQLYYLRLAILLGCMGIFMNLIRGEVLDQSLHYYLLTPVPRGVLLAGKFAAGLAATAVIFAVGTALQTVAMLWQYDAGQVAAYLGGTGWHDTFAYLGVSVLACAGYGSLFLAAGLFFRNPIGPAAAVLLWESVNLFIPGMLKWFSVIYYLQSLCPVPLPPDPNRPALLNALVSNMEPAPKATAVAIVLSIAAIFVITAIRSARRLEINYAVE